MLANAMRIAFFVTNNAFIVRSDFSNVFPPFSAPCYQTVSRFLYPLLVRFVEPPLSQFHRVILESKL